MTSVKFSLVLFAACALAGSSLSAATRTVTGIVTDAKCGAKHSVADAIDCTRDCAMKGSDYALVVDGLVYTLKADASSKAELRKLAGKVAVVRGDVEDTTVTVASVTKAKKLRKH
jgi:hypothetical protein